MPTPEPNSEPSAHVADLGLRLILAQLPAILWTTDVNLRGTWLMGAGLKRLGITASELTGVSLLDYMRSEPNHPAIAAHHRALLGETVTFSHEWQGSFYQNFLEPLRSAEGEIIGVIGLGLDISELHRAQEELRQANFELQQCVGERTRALADAIAELVQSKKFVDRVTAVTPAVIYVYDLVERRDVYVNDQLQQMLGYSVAEAMRPGTRIFSDNFHPDDVSLVAAAAARLLEAADGEIVSHEYRLRHARGDYRWLRSRDVVFARAANGRPTQILGLAIDITEQREIAASLEGEQHLLRRLLDLQNRERRIVAYELHDGFVQQVIGAQMRLAGVAGWDPPPAPELLAEIEAVSQLLRKAIGEARHLIGEMRPMVIETDGLVPAIDDLVRDLADATGVDVEFQHQVNFHRLSPEFEGNVFRIVQEALSNVRRHSQATRAQVRLRQTENHLAIEICDNGIGFNPAWVPKNHFGLEGIRERARLFGGKSRVESRAGGNGTKIVVDLPLSAALPENSPGA